MSFVSLAMILHNLSCDFGDSSNQIVIQGDDVIFWRFAHTNTSNSLAMPTDKKKFKSFLSENIICVAYYHVTRIICELVNWIDYINRNRLKWIISYDIISSYRIHLTVLIVNTSLRIVTDGRTLNGKNHNEDSNCAAHSVMLRFDWFYSLFHCL